MTVAHSPLATYHDVPWLPAGSYVEVWTGEEPTDPSLTTSAFAFAFDDDGRMLLAKVRSRGYDLPGGHVEPGETAEDAVKRECREETGAVVNLLAKGRPPAPRGAQPASGLPLRGSHLPGVLCCHDRGYGCPRDA